MTYSVSEPAQIGFDNDWIKVSLGYSHTLGLKSDGTLWAWGYNHFGELGIPYDPNINNLLPVQLGTSNNWVDISTGSTHSCAISDDGRLWTCALIITVN
ncbi:hypothetical protein [Flavobacterium sp. 3HN19-14]|uniref:hypothetical protein n=1 Tax=Flavobacterium sp. 3HN19-14 TaxID=3448133 RepID=UPI003EE0A402